MTTSPLRLESNPRFYWYPLMAGGMWLGVGLFVAISALIMVAAGGGWDVLAITWLVPAFGFAWSIPQSFWWRAVLSQACYDFDGDAVTIAERRKSVRRLTLGAEVKAIRLVGLPPKVLDVILDKGSMTAFPSVDLLCSEGWIYGPKFAASAADLDRYAESLTSIAADHGVRFSRP